jgi:very-short-patch-repair endonuclease
MLRQESTRAESLLWERLRDRRLGGYKFRRQSPHGRFIADFYCAEQRLLVEIDGSVHSHQIERDAERTVALEHDGYRVVRYTNEQVEQDIEAVLANLLQLLHKGP